MFWYGAKCWKLFWNLLITKGSRISLLDISYLRTACMVYVWCSCGCSLNQSIFMHWCLRFWYFAVPLILSFNLATASISRREVGLQCAAMTGQKRLHQRYEPVKEPRQMSLQPLLVISSVTSETFLSLSLCVLTWCVLHTAAPSFIADNGILFYYVYAETHWLTLVSICSCWCKYYTVPVITRVFSGWKQIVVLKALLDSFPQKVNITMSCCFKIRFMGWMGDSCCRKSGRMANIDFCTCVRVSLSLCVIYI